MRLEGRTALVTGASRGLGAALARELARVGTRVVLAARDEAALAGVADGIWRAGGKAWPLVVDLAEPEAADGLAGAAAAVAGPVNVLVHNAATLGPLPLRPLLETDPVELARVVEVNLLAPFRLTRALVGSMVLRGAGLVAVVSSDAALVPYHGWGAYALSKAALEQMARVLALELEPAGVRALILDPGEMDTLMHAQAMPDADRTTLADPTAVAARVVALLQRADAWPSGARIEIGREQPVAAEAGR